MWRGKGRDPLLHSLFVFEWCTKVLEAKTLISYYILLKKIINMKIKDVIYEDVALLLAIISLDFKLVYNFCKCLSEEWSATTNKEERRLCISS